MRCQSRSLLYLLTKVDHRRLHGRFLLMGHRMSPNACLAGRVHQGVGLCCETCRSWAFADMVRREGLWTPVVRWFVLPRVAPMSEVPWMPPCGRDAVSDGAAGFVFEGKALADFPAAQGHVLDSSTWWTVGPIGSPDSAKPLDPIHGYAYASTRCTRCRAYAQPVLRVTALQDPACIHAGWMWFAPKGYYGSADGCLVLPCAGA